MGPEREPEEGLGPRTGWGFCGRAERTLGSDHSCLVLRSWRPGLGWARRQEGRTFLSCFRPKTELKALA